MDYCNVLVVFPEKAQGSSLLAHPSIACIPNGSLYSGFFEGVLQANQFLLTDDESSEIC